MSYGLGYNHGFEDAMESFRRTASYDGWEYVDDRGPRFFKEVGGQELEIYVYRWVPIDAEDRAIAGFLATSGVDNHEIDSIGNPYTLVGRGENNGKTYRVEPGLWGHKPAQGPDGDYLYIPDSRRKDFDNVARYLEGVFGGAGPGDSASYESFFDLYIDEGYDAADHNTEFRAGTQDLTEDDMPTTYEEAVALADAALDQVIYSIEEQYEGEEAAIMIAEAQGDRDGFLQSAREFFG